MALMTQRTSTSNFHSYAASSSCIAPPPTCNLLDAAQRTRLIKSSRKLGKMLGATPYVFEENEPRESCSTACSSRSASPTPKRSSDSSSQHSGASGSGLSTSVDISYAHSRLQTANLTRTRSASATSTTTGVSDADSTAAFLSSHPHLARQSRRESLAPPSLGRQNNSDRQPILRLPTLFTSTSDSATSPSPMLTTFAVPSSPSSTSSSPLSPFTSPSPITPSGSSTSLLALSDIAEVESELSFLEMDETRIRKRRMDKLTRHLGECVPAELVFGPASKSGGSASARRPATAPAPPPAIPDADRLDRPQLKQLRRTSVSIMTGASLTRSSSALSSHILSRSHQAVLEDAETASIVEDTKGLDEGNVHQLVDDEWTPAAYQDVVRRLRALK